jgi:hypothetical protein
MAEFSTIIFPLDAHFMPQPGAVKESLALVDAVYRGFYPIQVRRYDTPGLVSSGANFDRFFCPACDALVTAYDYAEWWYSSPVSSPRGPTEIINVPCCGARVPFQHLDVDHHVGFARFQIEVEGAGEDVAPNEYQLHQLESLLGCRLKRIVHVTD